MKKILRATWMVLSLLLAITYITASICTYIPPSDFSFGIFFILAFPYLLLCTILFCIISFFISKRVAFLLLIILPAGITSTINSFAFHLPNQWIAEKDSATLRVMTWNVRNFDAYLRKKQKSQANKANDQMIEAIHLYDPDILCIQEYRDVENSKKRISVRRQLDSLGYKYFFCSNDTVIQKKLTVYTGVAIFSKAPLSDSGRAGISGQDNRNFIFVDVSFLGKPLRIFTAHLESFALYHDTGTYSNEEDIEALSKDRKFIDQKLTQTERIHTEQVSIIRKKIDSSSNPVIYCGDINTTPASYNYRMLKGNLQDAFLEKGSGIGATFYKVLPTLRIDMCFVDDKLTVQQCKVEQKRLSDHYPVITDVKWKY